ncbi:MAG: DUF2721 domain-containing protein [Candidatus Marinimicrobia bacterium]|nr:DUF2721 domain-containing protein [Candidatus Neomarinimicrobiota bacterium]
MNETIIEIIKGMLSPGIMISASGLLLIGMSNKYALVINRIRTLNEELRYLQKEDSNNLTRQQSILMQIPLLVNRMKYIREVIWLYTLGIALLISSIFAHGIYYLFGKLDIFTIISLILFFLALLLILIGAIIAVIEVRLGAKILIIETKDIKLDT